MSLICRRLRRLQKKRNGTEKVPLFSITKKAAAISPMNEWVLIRKVQYLIPDVEKNTSNALGFL